MTHATGTRAAWHLRLRRWVAVLICHSILPDDHGIYWPAPYTPPDDDLEIDDGYPI